MSEVERVRAGLDQGPLTHVYYDAVSALDSLTAALEREKVEVIEWKMAKADSDRELELAEARAQKAEAVVEEAIAHVESLGYTYSARYLRELRDEPT